MPDPSDLHSQFAVAFPGAEIAVEDTTGTGDHFRVAIVANQFAGLSRIEQHRLVYAAVQSGLDDGSIHALSIQTRTP